MKPQDRSLKHHDTHRKEQHEERWRCFRCGNRRRSGRNLILFSFEWSSGCCCVDLTVSLVVISLWVLQWSTNHACANSSQYILHVCSGQTFVSCPRILPFTSFREMDLYFPAHWPGYYYKWEGNNIGWTAGSACNLLHICPFHGRLWARDLVHSLFPPGGRTVYHSIHQHLFQGI